MFTFDKGACVLVIWDWEYKTAPYIQPTLLYVKMTLIKNQIKRNQSMQVNQMIVPECDQGIESNTRPECVHTIIFKCIGSTCEKPYQKALELARSRLQVSFTVPVQFVLLQNLITCIILKQWHLNAV